MWELIKELIRSLFKQDEAKASPAIIVPPKEPMPEIPTPEEVKDFPKKEIEDFQFVDSSHYHDYVDPRKYKAPILSHKCTQGTGMIDDKWAKTKVICAENKIKLSGYHFYECKQDWKKQVEHYLKTHGTFELPPQVDYETYKTKSSEQTEADLIKDKEELYLLLCELEKRTGMTPCLYLNYSAAGRMNFDKKFARFPVWLARYNNTLGKIPLPWNDQQVLAWQFTETGIFPGFPPGNDVNIYYGKNNLLKLN